MTVSCSCNLWSRKRLTRSEITLSETIHLNVLFCTEFSLRRFSFVVIRTFHLFLNWSYFPFRHKTKRKKNKFSICSPSNTRAQISQLQFSSGYINNQIPNVYGQTYDSLAS